MRSAVYGLEKLKQPASQPPALGFFALRFLLLILIFIIIRLKRTQPTRCVLLNILHMCIFRCVSSYGGLLMEFCTEIQHFF